VSLYNLASNLQELMGTWYSYRVTLNQNEKTEDEEQRASSLKACHQRCANRTLEVLERNGSIFIKLGQHLVGAMVLDLRTTSNRQTECNELSPAS
jgi:predicted unusual protein kinase regulating ubiquinone biosynthesis (AarF/ABC1/UbiB family)